MAEKSKKRHLLPYLERKRGRPILLYYILLFIHTIMSYNLDNDADDVISKKMLIQ